MTTSLAIQSDPQRLQRGAVWADGVFCVIIGGLTTVATVPLSPLLGLDNPLIVAAVGIGTALYGFSLLRQVGRSDNLRSLAQLVCALNIAWVAASAALLIFGWLPMTDTGKWIVAGLADLVAAFAAVQGYAVWKNR